MMLRQFAIGSLVSLAGLLACSSDSSTGNTPGGTPSSSGGGTNACDPPAGTYTVHYVPRAGGTGPAGQPCPDFPDSDVEVKPGTTSDGGSSSQAGCTSQTDVATCKMTSDCSSSASGYTTKSHFELATGGGKITGVTGTKVTKDADSTVFTDCTYDFTYTKK